MKWNGIEVKVDAQGQFNAKVDDVEIREATYEKTKERIDKALKSRVEIKKKQVRLAVLVISEDDEKVVPVVVTGVNRTTRELMFEAKPKVELHRAHVIADTEKNRAAAAALIEASARYEAAKKVVERLQVFDKYKYGRIEPDQYMGVIERLEAAHAKSSKG